jgi:hypothetical protein
MELDELFLLTSHLGVPVLLQQLLMYFIQRQSTKKGLKFTTLKNNFYANLWLLLHKGLRSCSNYFLKKRRIIYFLFK